MLIIGGSNRLLGHTEPPRLGVTGDGWDELIENVCVQDQDDLEVGNARSGAAWGITGQFYLQEKRCVGFRNCLPVMEYRSKGIAGNKVYIASCTGYAEKVSGTYVDFPGVPTGPQKMNVLLSRVGVTIRSFEREKPSCETVSKAEVPPETFGIPSNPFTWLTDPSYNYPQGWVLDKKDGDQMPGTSLYAVVRYYSHYRRYEPSAGAS